MYLLFGLNKRELLQIKPAMVFGLYTCSSLQGAYLGKKTRLVLRIRDSHLVAAPPCPHLLGCEGRRHF